MPYSDDFGIDDNDTELIAAATQVEASQNTGGFESSTRPVKRRRISKEAEKFELSRDDNGAHSPLEQSACPPIANTTATQASQRWTALDDEPEEDLEYYFPGELEGSEEQPTKRSKHKIHIPKNGGYFRDQIFTQTQVGLDSSPSRIRGAVWKKPPPPLPPPFGASSHDAGRPQESGDIEIGAGAQQTLDAGFNSLASRSHGAQPVDVYDSDVALAARLQAEEDAKQPARQSVDQFGPLVGNEGSLDISQELADLPSDAFSSSSPEKSPRKEIVMISSQPSASQVPTRGSSRPLQTLTQMTIFGRPATQDLSAAKPKHAWPLKSKDEPPTHHSLSDKAMETWVYPTNLGTFRDYQYNIVSRSLYHNTLVALPTGLGKTFIAATVMLNYYRWTANAQIIFVAPTKPLIAQQMEACYQIVGIPRRDTVLMTGATPPNLRAEEWASKRVFFMTPQTVSNDLKAGICDPKKIVLVVIDEAHKATGSYAYTEVVAFLRRFNNSFRVHALTATPGSTVEAVQAVIDHLGIARVELRTEQSLDIRPYTHEKHTETELFEFSDEQSLIMDLFSKALRPVLEKLCTQNAYWSRDPMQLSAYGLTTARQKWSFSDAGRKAAQSVKGMVNALFTVLASLAHNIGLLKFHGIGPFYSGVLEFHRSVESGDNKGKYATEIANSHDFTKMMRLIRSWTNNPDFIGHPKLQYLREVVLNHFLDAGEGAQGSHVPPSATRVMVFTSYRGSTEEIYRVLKRNEPMIRPHVFVGQAASKSSEGMDQKKQQAVIQDFRSGKYNTLIATSIGEEGLDIGDVDLIVCYDASASPIRMLQRIGRTGRKRVGRVVLLLMKGKEENDYAKAQDNYAFIQKSIADASKYTYRDDQSPRILPKGVQPVVDKRIIEIPVENDEPIDLNEKSRSVRGGRKATKRPPKKFHMPDGVRTGFVKASRIEADDSDDSEDATDVRKKTAARKKKPAKTKATLESEPEPVQLPFLDDVLLNDEQQKELTRQYAQTMGEDEDLVVRAPDPSRYPETLRMLGVTKYIPHGRSAHAVARAMHAVHKMNDKKVRTMKSLSGPHSLQDDSTGAGRLVDSVSEVAENDDELPANPLSISREVPPKPRGRPKKTMRRTTSAQSTVSRDEEPGPAKLKKSRGRPRKTITRAISYASTAEEGSESSPEPTPANMRIGTQGIDLGTRDTSGEDEEEQPDSELEDFVVRSDQPIEMASSSQRFLDDTQKSSAVRPTKRKVLKKRPVRSHLTPTEYSDIINVNDNDGEETNDSLSSLRDESSSELEEIAAPTNAFHARRKLVVDSSDSDE